MPYQAKKYIPRAIFSEIASHVIKQPEITMITGSRQVGKTVLLEQLKNWLTKQGTIRPEQVIYYNLDILSDWEMFESQTTFIEFLKEHSQKFKLFVLVDEAQKVPEAPIFFKGIYDSRLNVKLVLTGSASLEIKAKLKETLAGRKRIFALSPFLFTEFLQAKNQEFLFQAITNRKKINLLDIKKLLKLYQEYAVYGGYPRVVLAVNREDKIAILQEIYSSYVEKEAVGFLAIKNRSAFSRLLKLLSTQVGQLFKIEELAMNLGVDRQTIERYITVLEETFIIRKLSPYFRNPRQEIIKANKIFFLDTGLRNIVLGNLVTFEERLDQGAVLENIVFQELWSLSKRKAWQLHFWRTKQKTEVDFVVERDAALLPIEVKQRIKSHAIPPGLKNFIAKFSPPLALIVNLREGPLEYSFKKTKVQLVYPFFLQDLLTQVSSDFL